MASFDRSFGECMRCGRGYPSYTERCRNCDFGLLRKDLRASECSEPSIPEKILDALDTDLFKYLNLRRIDPQQFKSLLAVIGPEPFVEYFPKNASRHEAFGALWRSDRETAQKIIEFLLQVKIDAKSEAKLWDSILRSESQSVFYIASTKPYEPKNLLKDIRENLGLLEILEGDLPEEKLASLKDLYFQNHRLFRYALTLIAKSVTVDDFPKESWPEDNIAYPEHGVVNEWYFYNKFGGRSGQGRGSRG